MRRPAAVEDSVATLMEKSEGEAESSTKRHVASLLTLLSFTVIINSIFTVVINSIAVCSPILAAHQNCPPEQETTVVCPLLLCLPTKSRTSTGKSSTIISASHAGNQLGCDHLPIQAEHDCLNAPQHDIPSNSVPSCQHVFPDHKEISRQRTRPRQTTYRLTDFMKLYHDPLHAGNCEQHVKYSGETDVAPKGSYAAQINPNASTLTGRSQDHKPLDAEQCWPFLKKPCTRQSALHDNNNIGKKSRTFEQRTAAENHERNVYISPCMLLMLNKDFIITSPLKENLLFTLALMGAKCPTKDTNVYDLHTQTLQAETKRQVLVGQFKAFSVFLDFKLGHDAMRVYIESNAGGTSTISESLSVEYFVRRFQAKDIVTEMEVEYCSFNWKKVDYICTLYGQRVGVSVTRAMSFPNPKDFSPDMAYRLLYKKLYGLIVARDGVSARHCFSQCILHVWCETQETANIMQREYGVVSRELDISNDVVMVLTVADGLHARPIFYESILRNSSK